MTPNWTKGDRLKAKDGEPVVGPRECVFDRRGQSPREFFDTLGILHKVHRWELATPEWTPTHTIYGVPCTIVREGRKDDVDLSGKKRDWSRLTLVEYIGGQRQWYSTDDLTPIADEVTLTVTLTVAERDNVAAVAYDEYSHGVVNKFIDAARASKEGKPIKKYMGRTYQGPYADKVSGYTIWIVKDPTRRATKEHIMVMESLLGRRLVKGENVRHINGVRDDNRPENLELWVTSQPRGQRPQDLVAWAKEILNRYDWKA